MVHITLKYYQKEEKTADIFTVVCEGCERRCELFCECLSASVKDFRVAPKNPSFKLHLSFIRECFSFQWAELNKQKKKTFTCQFKVFPLVFPMSFFTQSMNETVSFGNFTQQLRERARANKCSVWNGD